MRDFELLARTLKKSESKGNPQTRTPKVSVRKQAKAIAAAIKLLEGILVNFEQLRELGLVEADMELAAQIETRIEWAKTQK